MYSEQVLIYVRLRLARVSARVLRSEKGSLALEQVLFIGAVVALAAGLFAFYDNLAAYFSNIGFADPPSNFGENNN